MMIGKGGLFGLMLAALVLPGCTESVLAIHTIKTLNESQQNPGKYKVGNPYEIKGIRYVPQEDPYYDKIGVASWYGPNFHGKATANGETYNQWALTAAHKTLAMPTFARVTNLDNGRSIVVRINDRGPFAKDRIIDMSRRGAELLGFIKQGTAKVRVQAVDEFGRYPGPSPQKSRELAAAGVEPQQGNDDDRRNALASKAASNNAVVTDTAPATATPGIVNAPKIVPASTESVTIEADGPWFVQAGAFSDFANANKVASALKPLGPTRITETVVDNRSYFRVRIGPLPEKQAAQNLWRQILNGGFPDARLVAE